MPLILPGLNEAKFKTLAKQLHKTMQAHPLPDPSLVQVQEWLAQALGHAHLYAAKQHWQQFPASGSPSPSPSPLSPSECQALGADLFARAFFPATPDYPQEAMFCLLAVTPGGVGNSVATVHFSFAPPVWERHGHPSSPEAMLETLMDQTPWATLPIALDYHDHLRLGWPVDWAITLREDHRAMPTLVVTETETGTLDGVVMIDAFLGHGEVALANVAAEPHEVQSLLAHLKNLSPYDDAQMAHPLLANGWSKGSNVTAASLEELLQITPETPHRQKRALLYRWQSQEWVSALINMNTLTDQPLATITWDNVADHFPTRVSKHKKKSRPTLPVVRRAQSVEGDWDVLDRALSLFTDQDVKRHTKDLEQVPAILHLCAWWNTHAPESMRSAQVFRAYVWSKADRMFEPLDPEEPPRDAEDMVAIPCYALFERPGRPTVALAFQQGRAFNVEGGQFGGTQTHYANGTVAWEMGCPLEEVDEAHYSVQALASLKEGEERRGD